MFMRKNVLGLRQRLCSSPGEPAQKGPKGEPLWPGEQPYDPILKSGGLPWDSAGSLGEKSATAGPSQPAFKYTWNGTTEACVLMDLLLHILKWPFMFGGAD